MRERIRAALPAVVGFVLFVVALDVLQRELRTVTWHTLSSALMSTPPTVLVVAAFLTALNYAVLTQYDFIALAYIGKTLPRRRVAATSLLAYAIANNVGFAMLSGASVRYRFYTRWGLTAADLSRIVISDSVTFWLGLLALGGLSLALGPSPSALGPLLSRVAAPVGWALVGLSLAYVVVAAWRRTPLHVRGVELPLPPARLALAQLTVSAIDWALAGAVFYTVLPPSHATFIEVLGVFFLAQLLGLASHIPGGVGVFESVAVLLLKPFITSAALVPALVVYRTIYYLLPLSVALVALVVDAARVERARTVRVGVYLGRLTEQLLPKVLAGFTFIAGVVLLFSGATPAAAQRLAWLNRVLPLGIIETSHVIGSIAGAALLLLSQGLSRRLDAAYYLTVAVAGVGMIVSMLKGGDYEEAIVLGVLLLLLRRARSAFDRHAALLATRFSPAWIAAVAAALIASVWLGVFAFKHVEYSRDLWWQFEWDGEASRFLRGSVAAATVVWLFAVARLIGHAPHEAEPPSESDLQTASAIIAAQHSTFPYLVYLRDKSLLFDERGETFVMYGVQGRTWVALGDPVGPPQRVPDLIRLFLEKCDVFGGTPVFYEVGQQHLHHYADFGLTFVKLGEEARVDLQRFTVDGAKGSKFRYALHRMEREGASFRLLCVREVPAVIDELQLVSDAWLEEKSGAEKGFSLGFFNRDYVARFPVAVIERAGRIQAFANLWPGPGKEELSVDLMRYRHDAPSGVMDALFAQVMMWGKRDGYRWFALGMAPMSGFEHSSTSTWLRAGTFLYEHGAALYNFQGLRAYKDKFDPVWESRYLAYPGGLTLPRIGADVAALVAGGYRRLFTT